MTGIATTTLESLVCEQAKILLDLTALSDRQQAAVVRRDADTLDLVLDQRQTLITRLAEVAETLSDRSAELQAITTAGDGRGEHLARDLAEASRLWSRLASRDSEDLEDLRVQRDELANELAEIGRVERAKGAYGTPKASGGGAIFQDTQA